MPPVPAPTDDFEVFKGSLLPSNVRPQVVIAWQVFAENGLDSELRLVQYFVIVPGAEVIGQQMSVSAGQLEGNGIARAMPLETMRKFALSRAQMHLDELAVQQLGQNHAPRTFYPPVTLEPATAEDVLALALAEEYSHAWDFIRDHTQGQNLRLQMGTLLKLRRMGFAFEEVPSVPVRMR